MRTSYKAFLINFMRPGNIKHSPSLMRTRPDRRPKEPALGHGDAKELISWVKNLTDRNLLVIYDVMLDLRDKSQISQDIRIPALPATVRFSGLMPYDGVNMRDSYLQARYEAIECLKKRGIIKQYLTIDLSHRWEDQIQVELNIDDFCAFFKIINKKAGARFKTQSSAFMKDNRGIWLITSPLYLLYRLILLMFNLIRQLWKRKLMFSLVTIMLALFGYDYTTAFKNLKIVLSQMKGLAELISSMIH